MIMPDDLKALLLETDGVARQLGEEIYTVAKIKSENRLMRETPNFRELYWPFDEMLIFADNKGGDLYAFKALAGNAENWSFCVYGWNHEDDSRVCVAGSLEQFIERWFNSELEFWAPRFRWSWATSRTQLTDFLPSLSPMQNHTPGLWSRLPVGAVLRGAVGIFRRPNPTRFSGCADRAERRFSWRQPRRTRPLPFSLYPFPFRGPTASAVARCRQSFTGGGGTSRAN